MHWQKYINIGALTILFLGLAACSNTEGPVSARSKKSLDFNSAESFSRRSLTHGNLWKHLRDDFALQLNLESKAVQKQIKYLQKYQNSLNHTLLRGAPYIYYVYQETKKRHLPAEIALIPIIESSYNPFLYSETGAAGLWQMMPGTASGFGLKINWWYDGRRDVVSSTKAALKYLTYLDYFFDDWLLAIAAYDAGEGKVQRALKYNERHGFSLDFWSLKLPKETMVYIPKLLALRAIIANPKRYGIKLVAIDNAPYFAEVDVGSQIDMQQAAQLAEVEVATIHLLNPGFRRWASDPDGPYSLLIPEEQEEVFQKNLANLPEEERVSWQEHKVVAKESLGAIARKYHTDVALLRKINELKNNVVKTGQILLIPKTQHHGVEKTAKELRVNIAAEKVPGAKQTIHKVQPQDTVAKIARKYGVKPEQIIYWNQLRSRSEIQERDEIVIWKSTPRKKGVSKHKVRKRV